MVPPSGQFLNNLTHKLAKHFGTGAFVASSFMELQILCFAFLWLGVSRILTTASLMVLAILFSLTPYDLRKFLMKAFMK